MGNKTVKLSVILLLLVCLFPTQAISHHGNGNALIYLSWKYPSVTASHGFNVYENTSTPKLLFHTKCNTTTDIVVSFGMDIRTYPQFINFVITATEGEAESAFSVPIALDTHNHMGVQPVTCAMPSLPWNIRITK